MSTAANVPTNDLSTDSEQANALRYVGARSRGHVESHFLKANSPDGSRAIWIKHTVLHPLAGRGDPVAEVWAIAFERCAKNGAPRVVALKQRLPIRDLAHESRPFLLRTPDAELRHGVASGTVKDAAHTLTWRLSYGCPSVAFRPFPLERMYTAALPRTKTLTPVPNTRATGWFDLDGERWQVDGWPAAQGHNWGQAHAEAYAWVHCNAWDDPQVDDVFIELLSARVKLGPVVTPWLSVGALTIGEATYRFDGPRALLSRRVSVSPRAYTVRLQTKQAVLDATFHAEPQKIAGLRYEDPDGSSLFCLNSKLAYAEVRVTAQGRTWSFKSDKAALEVGTRKGDHGLTIMV